MKKLLFFAFFLLSLSGFSQQNGKVLLEWSDKKELSFGTYSVNVPQFNPVYFSYDEIRKTISFTMSIPQSGPVIESSLTITNTQYQAISEADLGDLSRTEIPTHHNPALINSIARDLNSAQIRLSPIIKDGAGYKN